MAGAPAVCRLAAGFPASGINMGTIGSVTIRGKRQTPRQTAISAAICHVWLLMLDILYTERYNGEYQKKGGVYG